MCDADAFSAVKPVIQDKLHCKFYQRRDRRGISLCRFPFDRKDEIIFVALAQIAGPEDRVIQSTGFYHIRRFAIGYLRGLIVQVILAIDLIRNFIIYPFAACACWRSRRKTSGPDMPSS